jgi:hypothetical protein
MLAEKAKKIAEEEKRIRELKESGETEAPPAPVPDRVVGQQRKAPGTPRSPLTPSRFIHSFLHRLRHDDGHCPRGGSGAGGTRRRRLWRARDGAFDRPKGTRRGDHHGPIRIRGPESVLYLFYFIFHCYCLRIGLYLYLTQSHIIIYSPNAAILTRISSTRASMTTTTTTTAATAQEITEGTMTTTSTSKTEDQTWRYRIVDRMNHNNKIQAKKIKKQEMKRNEREKRQTN